MKIQSVTYRLDEFRPIDEICEKFLDDFAGRRLYKRGSTRLLVVSTTKEIARLIYENIEKIKITAKWKNITEMVDSRTEKVTPSGTKYVEYKYYNGITVKIKED